MATVTVNYENGKPETYRSVTIFLSDGQSFEYSTGSFIKDWYNIKKKFLEYHRIENYEDSPSVDKFIEDGAPYDKAYISLASGEPDLNYKSGWIMFVEKGTTPTWEELKRYCTS